MYAAYRLFLKDEEVLIIYGKEEVVDKWNRENIKNGEYGSSFQADTVEGMNVLVQNFKKQHPEAEIIGV